MESEILNRPSRFNVDYRQLDDHALWNIVGLGLMGAAGVALNCVVVRIYGPAVLGIFNQVFAVFIVAGQLISGGLYFSTLQMTAVAPLENRPVARVWTASLLIGVVTAGLGCAGLWKILPSLGRWFQSPGVEEGLRWALPGLFFFALNKVGLAVVNGLSAMRGFAVIQTSRAILIVGSVSALAFLGWPGPSLPAAFTIAEAIVGVGLFLWLARRVGFGRVSFSADIFPTILFSLKGLLAGLLLEVNTRVDVLMLGFFMSDRVVGIYSFAALLAEGLLQVPYILSANVNALLTSCVRVADASQRKVFIQKLKKRARQVFWPILGVSAMGFPFLAAFFLPEDGGVAWRVFLMLTAGMAVATGAWPFFMILNQAQKPEWFTLQMIGMVGINVMANLFFIPIWGIYGAAAATAAVFAVFPLCLNVLMKKALGWSL